MMTKHTPGPWAFAKYSKKRFGLGCAGHGAWMFLQTIYEDADSPELRANARLIAAAPDLLNVVEKIAKWNKDYPSSRIYSYGEIQQIAAEMEAINEAARAAIAKATGEKHE